MHKFGKLLPFILLFVLSIVIVGLFNVLQVEVLSDIWTNWVFWNKVISQNLANALTLAGAIMLYLEILTEKDPDYTLLAGKVKDSVRKDLDSSFGKWVFDENIKEKKVAYKKKIQIKINKKERKAKPKDLLIWYDKELPESEKIKNRYCRKRLKLENSIKDEVLTKTVFALKVDYDRIDRSFIETGEVVGDDKKNAKKDNSMRKLYENAPRFMFALAFALFTNALAYQADSMDSAFWFNFAFSLLLLVSMFINGRGYAISYVKRILLVDLNTRYNIIRDYMTSKLSKKLASKEVNNGGNS